MTPPRTAAALLSLPVALAVDLLTMVVLRRGLGMGRVGAVCVALVVTLLAWAVAARLLEGAGRRREAQRQEAPPR